MSDETILEPNGIVTITTDFGTRDAYVGAMKGVMLSIAPQLRLHDLAHEIEPQSIEHGATVLRGACPWFPPGTVHVGVVDPGVGTERAPVVIVAGGQAFVGPDNGLFGPVIARLGGLQAAYRLDRQGKLARFLPHRHASTFEGRDLFAPAAAALAAGLLAPADVGRPHDLVQLPGTEPVRAPGAIEGQVTYYDHFGNAITNVTAQHLEGLGSRACTVRLPGDERVPLVRTYGDAAPGALLAVIGSEGFLEIAVRDGSARARLGLAAGTAIRVEPAA
ncbi:MAG: SAM-dependent chlorinase/fluorinase [Thermodesulfobacteriota bacterium]